MLTNIFGNCPQVKVLDFLLATHEGQFNKKELARGSEISRPTLDKFINDFNKYGLINKERNLIELNNSSEIVKLFGKANIILADIESDYQALNYRDKLIENENNDWLDDAFEESEEEYDERVENEEEILVSKNKYEFYKRFYQISTMKLANLHTLTDIENDDKCIRFTESEKNISINIP